MKTQEVNFVRKDGTAGALRRHVRDLIGYATKENTMKKVRVAIQSDEPVGIIISRGDPAEARPIFSAYIWAAAPEPIVEVTAKVA
ncbi:MAG TPA: hypothetical protein VM053_08270 [Gemmatimonadaceae bacterium]|nr:hypothetical protein [Gemmatimonadaceae bacterium]